jgi:DNA invertase Pin-like site-specific DNA recombinase
MTPASWSRSVGRARASRIADTARVAEAEVMNTVALGYVRVSTEEQGKSGARLAAQQAAIEAEASRRGWEIVDIVEDVAGGRDLKRPGVQVALERMRHREAAVLVVAKLDRLSRSLLDFAGVVATAERERWSLVALDLRVGTSTASGQLMANVLASFAQFERQVIGQRTREGLAAKRAAGVRLGRPLSLDPAVRARIRADREAGSSYAAVARGLNAAGVPTAQGGARWRPSSRDSREKRPVSVSRGGRVHRVVM